jgi:hypothetical protein
LNFEWKTFETFFFTNKKNTENGNSSWRSREQF